MLSSVKLETRIVDDQTGQIYTATLEVTTEHNGDPYELEKHVSTILENGIAGINQTLGQLSLLTQRDEMPIPF